jgi:hypothetical protein
MMLAWLSALGALAVIAFMQVWVLVHDFHHLVAIIALECACIAAMAAQIGLQVVLLAMGSC